MYKQKSTAVIIPAYNEEKLIGETLKSLPSFLDRIYVIDDGSKDKTSEIVESISKSDSRILCLQHKTNKGPGAAVVTGYKKSLEEGIDITAVMDGDNQMSPKYLSFMLDPIVNGTADYTKGNRLSNPSYRTGMKKWRLFGNTILTFLTKIASGYWRLIDPQNGFTAVSKKVLSSISLDDVYPWYGYLNDLLVKMNVYNFRVVNISHPAKYGKEKSKIKYGRYIIKVSWLLLSDFIWRLKMKYIILSFHPLVLFYIAGTIITPAGLIGGVYSLYYKFVLGNSLFVRGVLSALLFIIGIQFLFFAMLFDMQFENSNNHLNGYFSDPTSENQQCNY